MAKNITASGNLNGADYTRDLDIILQELYGNTGSVDTSAVIGQIKYTDSDNKLSICTNLSPITFTELPFTLTGTVASFVASASITGLTLDSFGNTPTNIGVVDTNIITGTVSDDTIATTAAITARIAADILAHNVDNGVHGLTGTDNKVVGTTESQTLTDKTLTSPTITSPTITGPVALDPDSHTLVIGDSADTVSIPGNLVITGTTTTTTNLSTSDHDIFINTGAGSDSAITTGAGILLGNEGTYSGTRHGVTYTSGTGSRWTMSDDLRINGKVDVNSNNVITAAGAWNGTEVSVAKGGTGATDADGALTNLGLTDLLADNTKDVTLENTNYLTLGTGTGNTQKLTGGTVPIGSGGTGLTSVGAAGQTIVVDTAGTGLEYSGSIVNITQVGDWARKDGGDNDAITEPTADNFVLHFDGTNYAFINANTLDVKDPTGDLTLSGLVVTGDTKLGNATGDNITLAGSVNSNIIPSGSQSLGSSTQGWGVYASSLEMGGTSVTGIVDSTETFADDNLGVPTTKAVRDYVGSTEAGGSIVITGTGKSIPAGTIAIVTLNGVTKLWTANSNQTSVVLTTFSAVADPDEFRETVTGFTELRTGGGAGTVTINKVTVDSGLRTSGNFTMGVSVADENQLSVFLDGVYQAKDAYTVSGTTLAFEADELPLGTKLEVIIGSAVNFDGGVLNDVTATGTITAPNIGSASTTLLGDGSSLSGLPSGYAGWTVSDGTTTSLASSGETLTVSGGAGTTVTVSDNALAISSPSLGTGSTQAAPGNHDHEGTYTEPRLGSASTEGFRLGTTNGTANSDGDFPDKTLDLIYRNSTTDIPLASIKISDILSGFPMDSWTN